MKYNWYLNNRRPRSRLRKKGKGLVPRDPLWGGLRRAWVGYVIAKSQCDCEKMRKYAVAIRKFERLLSIEISEFPELDLLNAFDEDEKEEDDDSKLAIVDLFTNEKIKEADEDNDDYV